MSLHFSLKNRLRFSTALLAFAVGPSIALAQVQPSTSPEDQTSDPEQEASAIIVTGSRFGGRIKTDSPTPVDSISAEELTQGGRTEIQNMLKVVVPSFSTPRPAASGVADFTTPPTLRGLGPGEVLILVNGKRRHTTSDLNNSGGIGRGDVSTDFNAIPSAAFSRIEVLRDGAAAQYGSDAIAGVINQVLDASTGTRLQATFGTTTKGDGEVIDVSASVGVPLGADGVIRVTAAYQDHNATNRARRDTRQQYFGRNAAGALVLPSGNFGSGVGLTPSNGTLDPREATIDRDVFQQGEQPYTNKQIFYNLEAPASENVTVYSFGGYNRLEGRTFNFFRRAGQDETVRAIYPNGYLPFQEVELENFSTAVGIRGTDLAGFGWDLSSVYGVSSFDGTYTNSNNPSLGAASPADFYRGGSRFYQWTSNLDFTREIEVGDSSPLRVAAGLEYREETWRQLSGEPDSYRNGGIPILDGPNAGRPAPVGSQPSPGNRLDDFASADRSSYAVYAEVEREFFDRLLISGAVRHEEFSDFGGTTNYKAASRFKVTDWLSFRGSFSTGFRAPALAQSFYSAGNTTFINGVQTLVRIIPVDNPAARLIGASDLKPEKSRNFSVGAVVNVGGFTLSADAYRIKLRDRIAISTNFQDARVTSLLATNGFPGIGAAAFITNAVDTTTEGIDVTARYRARLSDVDTITATLAGNYNKSTFDRIAGTPQPLAALGITTPLFDLTQQVRFTDSQPRDKITLDLNYSRGPFSIALTNTRYGRVSTVALTNRTPAQIAALTSGYDVRLVPSLGSATNSDIVQTFRAKILTDLQVSLRASEQLTFSAGANNIFDIYPDENIGSTVASVAAGVNGSDNAGTLPYNALSPFGYSGRYVFVRANYKF